MILFQAHYRGYRLRAKLRMVLENVHLANNVFGEGAGSEDEIDFEEEIIVDYLDEVSSSNKGDPLIVRHLDNLPIFLCD